MAAIGSCRNPSIMRVLVACEFSGTVRDAFRARGHDAWSCDLLPTASPGLHYQGNVLTILDGWMPVRHQCECDPDGDGWCKLTDSDPSECCCVGPTQDEVEYMETDAGLFGRPENAKAWDLMIAHPPCTFLNSAGLHWNTRGRIEEDGRPRQAHTFGGFGGYRVGWDVRRKWAENDSWGILSANGVSFPSN